MARQAFLEEFRSGENARQADSTFEGFESSQVEIQHAVEILLTKIIPRYFPGFFQLRASSQELILMKLAYLVDVYDPSIFRNAEFCNKPRGPCSLRIFRAHKNLARASVDSRGVL